MESGTQALLPMVKSSSMVELASSLAAQSVSLVLTQKHTFSAV